MRSAAAVALHMHQPLIPAGGHDLRTAEIISNLKYMLDHRDIGDNHNAPTFLVCYKRMGEFIPQLIHEGKEPRVMLEYSGTLLYGLAQMARHDVLDQLRTITCDPRYRHAVEWLGAPWGHAAAPSTPAQDYRLHVRAWQHYFAATFGLEALSRVRGFSPSEMAPAIEAAGLRAGFARRCRRHPVSHRILGDFESGHPPSCEEISSGTTPYLRRLNGVTMSVGLTLVFEGARRVTRRAAPPHRCL